MPRFLRDVIVLFFIFLQAFFIETVEDRKYFCQILFTLIASGSNNIVTKVNYDFFGIKSVIPKRSPYSMTNYFF